MAEPPQDTNLLAQVGVGVTTVLGWLWAMIRGNQKKLEAVQERFNDHELHVAKTHPTKSEMWTALDKTVQPIHEKLDKISDKLDRDRDEEMQRLRELARDRRND